MDSDVDIDDIDRRLLNALLDDGRASARELAATADVATATATKRLQHMEDAGVIDGYRPRVDYEAFGYEVTAVFKLDVAGEGIETVVDELASTGRMIGVYEVTGDHDVVAVGKFTSTEAMNEQIKALLTHPNVRSANTNVVLDTVCENDQFPVTATSD